MKSRQPSLLPLGTGEAFDDSLGNTSFVLEVAGAPLALFDCGYQVPERLWRSCPAYSRLEGVFLTHRHADHAFGIVPLLARFWEEGRTRPLWVAGPRGTRSGIEKLLDLGYPGLRSRFRFPIRFVELRSGEEARFGGSLGLATLATAHSVPNLSVRATLRGSSFVLSGDGVPSARARSFVDGADLVIHEAYCLREGQIPVHSSLQETARLLEGARVGRIGVVHVARGERVAVRREVLRLSRRDPRWFLPEPGKRIYF